MKSIIFLPIFLFDWFLYNIPLQIFGALLILFFTKWRIEYKIQTIYFIIILLFLALIFLNFTLDRIRYSSLFQIILSLLLIFAFINDKDWINHLEDFIPWFSLFLMLVTIVQLLTSNYYDYDFQIGNALLKSPQRNIEADSIRASGLFEEPAHNAVSFMALSLLLYSSRKFNWLWVTSLGALATLSTIGIIFFLVSLSCYLISIIKKVNLIIAIVLLILAVLIPTLFLTNSQKISQITLENSSGWVRIIGPYLYYCLSVKSFFDLIIGIGMGQHLYIINDIGINVEGTGNANIGPNSFLGIFIDFGIFLGLIINFIKYKYLFSSKNFFYQFIIIIMIDFSIAAYYTPWYWTIIVSAIILNLNSKKND